MRVFLTIIAALISLSLPAAAKSPPAFEDFAVSEVYTGKPAKIRLEDRKSRHYATMLKEESHRRPNFAGHYRLASWGCGASCVMSAAIDAKTGDVAWLPFTVCCWALDIEEPLVFKPKSRLLIVYGSLNEKGGGTHYYEFDGRHFNEIKP